MKRYLGAALFIAAAACAGKKEAGPAIQTATVQRRDIVIEATASGAIEAINVVEVKSKASGLITQMPVETGTVVKPGDLIVQIDTRDVQSQLNQADADLNAAKEKLKVSQLQKKRSDDMFAARVITAQENETANLDLTNSSAAVLRATGNLELAQQRFDDATIRATVGGVILEKTVAPGGVIASATGSASGGTTLVKMADLSKVRVRAFFNETDIGNVSSGQPASVTVDAYPDRSFDGLVEKIEPQAVIQQNVTMFPVLITLQNQEGLLKPGMNGEVSVLVDERQGVLAVPNDAIRNPREAPAMAPLLGLNADTVQMQIKGNGGRSGTPSRGGAEAAPGAAPAAAPDTKGAPAATGTARGEVALDEVAQGQAQGQRRGAGGRGGRGGGFQGTPVPAEECAKITASIEKDAAKNKKINDLRASQNGLQGDARTAITHQINEIYKSIGVDSVKAGTCRRQASGAGGGGGGAGRGGRAGGAGGRGAARSGLQVASENSSGRARSKTGLVFVAQGGTYTPKIITMGPANFDFTEVLSGLEEGDNVVLMGALALAAARAAQQEQARKSVGNPLNPGATKGPGGGGPPGGGGGGGRGGGGDAGGGGGGGGGNRGGGGGRGGN